jgi:dipeptidase
VGGIVWYGYDDTYWTCYLPMYNAVTEIPEPFTNGDFQKFSWDNAWWVFNFVSNYANLKYSYMVKDMQEVQQRIERQFIAEQAEVDEKAKLLLAKDRSEAIEYLNKLTAERADYLLQEWTNLANYLLTKYNDGYIKNEKGHPEEVGYPQEWKRRVIDAEGERYRIRR